MLLAVVLAGCGAGDPDSGGGGTADGCLTLSAEFLMGLPAERMGPDDLLWTVGHSDHPLHQIGPGFLLPEGDVLLMESLWRTLWVYSGDDGSRLGQVGREGEGPGEFLQTSGVTVWADGSIVVADARNGRVVRFDGPAGESVEYPDTRLHSWDPTAVLSDGSLVATDLSPFEVLEEMPDGLVTRQYRYLALVGPDGGADTLRVEPSTLARIGSGNARAEGSRTGRFAAREDVVAFTDESGQRVRLLSADQVEERCLVWSDPLPVDLEREVERRTAPLRAATDASPSSIEGFERALQALVDGGYIPRLEPAFTEIVVAADGVIWTRLGRGAGVDGALDTHGADPASAWLGWLPTTAELRVLTLGTDWSLLDTAGDRALVSWVGDFGEEYVGLARLPAWDP